MYLFVSRRDFFVCVEDQPRLTDPASAPHPTHAGIQIGEELEANREKITNIRSKVRLVCYCDVYMCYVS